MKELIWDVVVVGAGSAGLSLAIDLHQTGHRVCVLEREAGFCFNPQTGYDPRIYTLTDANQAWLSQLGVWSYLDLSRIQALNAMQVLGDRDGRLRWSDDGYGLGVVLEGPHLQAALIKRAQSLDTTMIHWGVEGLTHQREEIFLKISSASGQTWKTRLLVAADGRMSPLRQSFGLRHQVIPYGQTALVANYQACSQEEGVAYQRFLREGVLAYLPLPEQRVSIVWSLPTGVAQEYSALSPADRLSRLNAWGIESVVLETEISAPQLFELSKLTVKQWSVPRFTVLGDAAHGVHPLAGQGLNLGLQGAACLGRVLAQRSPGPDCGDLSLLRRYERARKESVQRFQWVIDGLINMHQKDQLGRVFWRNRGMTWVNQQPFLKEWLRNGANETL